MVRGDAMPHHTDPDRPAWHDDYDALRDQARGETGPGGVPFLLAAAELADAHHDLARGFDARDDLVTVGVFGGRIPEAIAAFAWCLGVVDRDDGRRRATEAAAIRGHGLYWKFKWMLANAPDIPTIPRASLEAMFADMAARFRRLGIGEQAVAKLAGILYWDLGEEDVALEHAARAIALERDGISDCLACSANHAVRHHLRRHDLARALKAGEGILAGRMRCNSVPKGTYASLLIPLLAAGRGELARGLARKLLRQLKHDESDVGLAALAVRFLALTGNHARAWGCFTRFTVPAARLGGDAGVWTLAIAGEELARCLALSGAAKVHGHLPAAFLADLPDGEASGGPAPRDWPVAELAQACAARADGLTAAFDARNGNDTYSRRRRERLEAVERLRCDLPLVQPASAKEPEAGA